MRDRLSSELREALHELALLGALRDRVAINTTRLGELLSVSQQSASRRMLDLAKLGLIERGLNRRGQVVRITAKGESVLRERMRELEAMFDLESMVVLRGKVESGMGEGAYYMGMDHYQRQFVAKLGTNMYAGTLNVKLLAEDMGNLPLLRREAGIPIDGFQKEGRTFGGATCFPAELGEVDCWVISPHRTHYTETLEIIAPVRLRDRLKLKDGIDVMVNVTVAGPRRESRSA